MPALVAIAENVTAVPVQIVVSLAERDMVISKTGIVRMVIALLEAVKTSGQRLALLVNLQLTTSPF